MGIFSANIRAAGKTMSPGTHGEATYTENVAILPANAYIMWCFGRVKTAFAGVTAPQVSLGVSGDTERYMVSQPISAVNELIAGSPPTDNKATLGVKRFCAAMDKERITGDAQPIIATFSTSSTDFSGLTAGEVEFVIIYVDTNTY